MDDKTTIEELEPITVESEPEAEAMTAAYDDLFTWAVDRCVEMYAGEYLVEELIASSQKLAEARIKWVAERVGEAEA